MTTWEVNIRLGWMVGLAIVASLLLTTIGVVIVIISISISIWTFVLSIVALAMLITNIYLVYRLWSLLQASYEMDRNTILIHWGDTEHQIPMASVRGVLSGSDLIGAESTANHRAEWLQWIGSVRSIRMQTGLRWPGYSVGFGESEEIGPILFYATAPLSRQVIIRTEGMAYAISPNDMEAFLSALAERLEMGPTQEVEERSLYPGFLDWQIWQDRLALGILASSIGLLVLLVGVLCWRYPHLPMEIAMRFTFNDEALLIVNRMRIFYLAVIGSVFLVLNGGLGLLFYIRERIIAYILWSGLLILQGGVWVAALSVLLKQ
ncbi:MAG: hypothetical protein JXA33_06405 [Anaerolineae bacterium]|nr:hypothetical protein [Anaerolineae bacterium]